MQLLLDKTDIDDVSQLAKAGAQIRHSGLSTLFQPELEKRHPRIPMRSFRRMMKMPFCRGRSPPRREDMPDASFAGQQETFLNVQGSMRFWWQ